METWRYVRFAASSSPSGDGVQARGASSSLSVPPPRWEDYQGVSHLVIPVIALLGDIAIFPMGADCYELVPEVVLNSAPMSWNGHPVLADHPNDGESGACTPEILSRDQFGLIFNSYYDYDSQSLQMEAWLNPERAMAVGQDDVFDRCAAGETLEISVGAYIRLMQAHGVARNGREYELAWTLIHPDHLAIGLKGKEGACSINEGCGTNRLLTEGNEVEEDIEMPIVAASKQPVEKPVVKPLVPVTQPANPPADKPKVKTRVAKSGTGNGVMAQFMKSLRSLMSMMPSDQAEEAGELIGYELMKSLSDSAKSHLTQMDTQIASLIAGEVETPTETREDEDAEEVMEDARLQAIRSYCFAIYSTIGGILDQASSMRLGNDNYGYGGYAAGTPEAIEARAAAGKRNSKKDQANLQNAHDYLAKVGAACSPDNVPKNMSSGAQKSPCGCGKLSQNSKGEEEEMAIAKDKMKEVVTRLLAGKGTPEDAKLMKDEFDVDMTTVVGPVALTAPVVAPVAPVTPVAAAADPAKAKPAKTEAELEAEYLAGAPPSVRSMFEKAKKQEAETRAGMIRQLTAAQTHYDAAALATMDTNSLAGLVTVMKLNEPAPRVNYLGLGLPNPNADGADEAKAMEVYGAPPSGIAEYAAASKGEKAKAN